MLHSSINRESGAALVLAMMIFTICAGLLVGTQKFYSIFYQKIANAILREQAYEYLIGAEELASLALMLDARKDAAADQPRDDLRELWAQPSMPYTLDGGGILLGSLEDLTGKFNLNHLVAATNARLDENNFSASEAQFIRLLRSVTEPPLSLGEAISVTEAVIDWIDVDAEPRAQGAEDMWYGSQQPPYRAANRPMASISELRLVRHVTSKLYEQLAPLITVWPRMPRPMNIHTVGLPLLRTFNGNGDLNPLSHDEAKLLLHERQDAGFNDVESMLASPVFAGRIMSDLKPLLGTSSQYFRLSASVELGSVEMDLYCILERSGQRVTTLSRALIPL